MPEHMSEKPRLIEDVATLRRAIAVARSAGQTIGLVPTMGALHEGHMSLVRRSVATCDVTIATIFVNPTQFGPQEDFSRYPRTLPADMTALAHAGADLVFVPSADTVYGSAFSTYVDPPAVSQLWEGQCRPGHFRGVATVVLKLFHLIPAEVAFFGQKDYQQTRVIQDMVRDLDVDIRIDVCATVREADGLALSSRNRYLSAEERARALGLFQALEAVSNRFCQGEQNAALLTELMTGTLRKSGISRIDYAVLVNPHTLASVEEASADTVALIAAYVGTTRLIDNRRLGPSGQGGNN